MTELALALVVFLDISFALICVIPSRLLPQKDWLGKLVSGNFSGS